MKITSAPQLTLLLIVNTCINTALVCHHNGQRNLRFKKWLKRVPKHGLFDLSQLPSVIC